MKKTILTLAFLCCMSLNSFAQWGGGLFQRGAVSDEEYYGAAGYFNYTFGDRDPVNSLLPGLPSHGYDENQNAPLGSGVLLLIGFGAAYALRKKVRNKSYS